MKIIVCIKQVPSTNEVRMDPVTNTIVRDSRQAVTNPFDTYAIEAAVRLKEKLGGTVYAMSMGIPATERLLRDAMARGVDEALLLSDRAFAGSDTLATSYVLSLGVAQIGAFDLILCGRMAVDGDTAQIGPELAAQLGIPYATDVCEILEATEQKLRCRKHIDGGFAEVEITLPALVTVTKDVGLPRLPSISGIRFSLTAPFRCCSADDAAADKTRCGLNGSPTQVVRSFAPDRTHRAISLAGSADETADHILRLLEEVR